MADLDEEPPLDPAALRLQRKLRRLMLVAGLTLGIGLLAVFAGIVYRIVTAGKSAAPPPGEVAVGTVDAAIPAGAHLVSSTVANGRIVLVYDSPAGTTLILVDPASLAVVGRLQLKPAAPAASP